MLARDDIPDNLKIYKDLRLNIIHGQICLASFFKWKRDVKEKQVGIATNTFKQALLEDQKNEAKRSALKMLEELQTNSPNLAQRINRRKREQSNDGQSVRSGSPTPLKYKDKVGLQVPDIDLNHLASTEAGTARSPNTASSNRANLQLETAEDNENNFSDEPESPNSEAEA